MKKVLMASLFAVAPLAQAADDVTIDHVGHDVAAGAIVIHGANFVGAMMRAPDVRVGPVGARVTYYTDDFVVVEAPAGLPAGHHAVIVRPAGERQVGQMRLALAVPVPYVIERPELFARR